MYQLYLDNLEEFFNLQDTDRNKQFIAAFRDQGEDINGQRFILDVIHGFFGEEDIISFTVTPATKITLIGKDFNQPEGLPSHASLQ